jgi:hypothetical protein
MRARPFREFFEIVSSIEGIVFAFEISFLDLHTAREQTTSFARLHEMLIPLPFVSPAFPIAGARPVASRLRQTNLTAHGCGVSLSWGARLKFTSFNGGFSVLVGTAEADRYYG